MRIVIATSTANRSKGSSRGEGQSPCQARLESRLRSESRPKVVGEAGRGKGGRLDEGEMVDECVRSRVIVPYGAKPRVLAISQKVAAFATWTTDPDPVRKASLGIMTPSSSWPAFSNWSRSI